jgi:hypothetical protein
MQIIKLSARQCSKIDEIVARKIPLVNSESVLNRPSTVEDEDKLGSFCFDRDIIARFLSSKLVDPFQSRSN